jgi:hypothetical protein
MARVQLAARVAKWAGASRSTGGRARMYLALLVQASRKNAWHLEAMTNTDRAAGILLARDART